MTVMVTETEASILKRKLEKKIPLYHTIQNGLWPPVNKLIFFILDSSLDPYVAPVRQ